MKHLTLHLQAANAVALPPPSPAMEGFVDTLKEKFGAIKASLGGKDEDMSEQLTLNDRAVQEFRNLLVNFKSELSQGKVENTKGINIARHLAKIGIEANSPKEVIQGLKTRNAELRKQLREVAKLAKDAPNAIKKGNSKDHEELTQRANKLKEQIKITPVDGSPRSQELVFTKRETLELTDCLIDYCDLYFQARKQENLVKLAEDVEKAQQAVPKMEARDGGFLDGIAWVIVSTIKLIFFVIIFIIVAEMMLFIAVANPFILLVSAMIVSAMYALREAEGDR